MHARILSATENSRTVWHDHGDGQVTIQKVADVTNAVERAKELHNMGAHTTGMGDKHAASIPVAAASPLGMDAIMSASTKATTGIS